MLYTFRVAMVNRFRTDSSMASLRVALPGGFHEQPAPSGTPFPHATFLFVDANPQWALGHLTPGPGKKIEEFRMQFDIWTDSKSAEAASQIFELWIVAWDNIKFSVPGYNLFRFQRLRQVPTKDPDTYFCGVMSEYLVQM